MQGLGVARNKVRELSRRAPSGTEFLAALLQLERPDVPDMLGAVLGASVVEYALEEAIRLRLKLDDAETWSRMIDSTGPLRDFHTKIITGFALGIFSEEIRLNLNLVRDIRNAFAHSRMDLRFDNPTLVNALTRIQPVRSAAREVASGSLSLEPGKRAYLQLCFSLFAFFQAKYRKRHRKARNLKQEQELLDRLLQATNSERR
jgi:hypothetical protein